MAQELKLLGFNASAVQGGIEALKELQKRDRLGAAETTLQSQP